MDRLTSLMVFGRVVENGGFSAAARRLSMSVTMVSNHIQDLEERLGARLLNRTTRRVHLTEIGQAYYERSRQILADLEDADRMAGAAQATPRGTLRLFTSPYVVRFLSPVIDEYLAQYPAVSLDLATGQRMVDLVEEGFDLAIRTLPPPDSSLIVRQLAPWNSVICCSPEYLESHPAPQRPEDLVHHNCLRYAYYPYGDEWRFHGPGGEAVSVRVSGNVISDSAEVLRHLTLMGRGLAWGPSFIIGDDLKAGRLVRTMPGYTPLEFAFSAIYPHRNYVSSKVRTFIDLLVERFAEHRREFDLSRSTA
jgi:DNA-binding transcriptional LysR family regulator